MFTPILATTGAAGETVNFNATTIALTAPSFGIDEAFVFISSEILVSGEVFTVESAEEITETFSGGYIHATLAERNLLRSRNKKEDDLALPIELRQVAEQAVKDSISASFFDGCLTDEREHLLQAMEAWESYDEAYRRAYKDAYIAEIVKDRTLAEIKRARRNRAVALLLLH